MSTAAPTTPSSYRARATRDRQPGAFRHRDGQDEEQPGRPHDPAAHAVALGRQTPGQSPGSVIPSGKGCGGRSVDRRHPGRARPRVGQDGAAPHGRGPQVCSGQSDDELQPCRLDQPVQVDHQAAFCLMVLPPKNLMALRGVREQPVGPSTYSQPYQSIGLLVRRSRLNELAPLCDRWYRRSATGSWPGTASPSWR
jgi:hypothetical protein